MRVVPVGEVPLRDFLGAAEAFGDIFPGQLEMNTARVRVFGAMNLEEAPHFLQHAIEWAGFIPDRCLDRIPMHGIAGPDDASTLACNSPQQARELLCDLVCAKPANQSQPAGFVFRVKNIDQLEKVIFRERRSAFQTDWVFDAATKLDMRAIELPCAIADP